MGNQSASLLDRFHAGYVIEPNSGCWLWTGYCVEKRNGNRPRIYANGRSRAAYRVGYELLVGPVPDGKMLCHKCNVSTCVNPAHLYAGTAQDNADDRRAFLNLHKPTCSKGHPYSGENLIIEKNGQRVCRTCHRQRIRDYRAGIREGLKTCSGATREIGRLARRILALAPTAGISVGSELQALAALRSPDAERVGLAEAARDLLEAQKRDERTVGFRVDLWKCLAANLGEDVA